MQATLIKNLFRRLQPTNEVDAHGALDKGSTIEIAETVRGKMVDGEDKWYKAKDGFFYWGGGVLVDGAVLKSIETETRITFKWFHDLGIENVWKKYNEYGENVVIAVLDTGYNKNNPDIKNSITGEKIIIEADKYPGVNLVTDDNSKHGHGSRCTSLIGSRNSFKWVIGIAPKCKILIGKISSNREIRDNEYIIKGIDWAIKQGADIISISYSLELTHDEVKRIEFLFDALISNKPVLVFASAGNSDGNLMTGERYPASFHNCISIGAVDEANILSLLNIVSPKTILHAPGEKVESFGLNDFPDPASGTSYSTPIVTAIAGLAVSYLKKNGKKIDRKELLDKMIETGINISGQSGKKIISAENLFNKIKI